MVDATAIRGSITSLIENLGSTVTVLPRNGVTTDKWGAKTYSVGEVAAASNMLQLNHFNNSLIPVTGVTPTASGTIAYTDGKLGANAIVSNGSDSSLSFGDVYGFNLQAATYSFWFKPGVEWNNSLSSEIAIIGALQAAAYEFRIGHTSSQAGKISIVLNNVAAGQNFILAGTTDTFETDTWYHVVVSHDWSVPSTKIYINGSLEGSTGSAMTYNASTSHDFRLFNRNGAFDYDGALDEFIVYDEQLSDEQVLLLYNSMVGSTITAVPDSLFNFQRQSLPQGIINRSSMVLICKGTESISVDDLVLYNGRKYKVINVQPFPINNVDLAIQFALEETHDNNP